MDGKLNSQLVLIGRDWGWQEARDGRPFVGESGQLLTEALGDAGLRRNECLISNCVNSRPFRDEWASHTEKAIQEGAIELFNLLALHPRRVIVAFGAEAFYTCATGQSAPRFGVDKLLVKRFGGTITEIRGYVWDGPFGPVLASVHPAFVLRSWLPWRATLSWDLAKAKRYVEGVGRGGERHSTFARDTKGALQFASELLSADVLAVDIETSGQNAPVCIAFAASPQEGVTFVLPRDNEIVRELLASPIPKVWQNGQFDLTILRRAGFTINGEQHDTMLAWHAKEPLIAGKSSDSGAKQSAKGLRFLASVLTDEPFWKDYVFQSEEDRYKLCATDARVTLEIFLQLFA